MDARSLFGRTLRLWTLRLDEGLNLVKISSSLPTIFLQLFGEFEDVFPNNIPHGFPSLRWIEHQIDLVTKASCPIGLIQKRPKKSKDK
ncbi:hypothetical protein CR513_22685, partial [Mucuna pruriens]